MFASKLSEGELLGVDTLEPYEEGLLLRLTLTLPWDSPIPGNPREYTDSRGEARRVKTLRGNYYICSPAEIPGLEKALEGGWSGNLGLKGAERYFLLPNGDPAGIGFVTEERMRPSDGSPVLGMARIVLVNLRLGKLARAHNGTNQDKELVLKLLS